MSKFKNILILMVCWGVISSCAKSNVLGEFSQHNSDEALLIDAQSYIDNSQWDQAIDIIENQLSAAFQARRDVINILAGAYAGKCGVNFFNLMNGIKNASASASQLFPFFLGSFSGVTADPASCEKSITLLQSIGGPAVRTSDENLFLAILGVARIATNLSAEIDVDHNGTMDTSSDLCHDWTSGSAAHPWLATDPAYALYPPPAAKPSHYLTDADVQKIGAGMGLIIENLAALGAVIGTGGNVVGAINSIATACTSLGIPCTATTPAAISATANYGFRTLLNSSSVGFGSCVPGSAVPAQLCCPTLKPPPGAGPWP
ncbi:MAG TPA: hypothetical protein VN132_13405 [Bdellovibrio sp.]|nr:hypothetical protein [Bdellovibrio sp.]